MLSDAGQALAQRYAAQLIALQPSAACSAAATTPAAAAKADPGELLDPRSVGVEHAALSTMRQSGLPDKLSELGLNRPQIAAALGNIVARMAQPCSDLATHAWLKDTSGLSELIDYDFEKMDLNRLYRVHHAHRAGVGVPLTQDRPGSAPAVPPR